MAASNLTELPWKNLTTFGAIGIGALGFSSPRNMGFASKTIVPFVDVAPVSSEITTVPEEAIPRNEAIEKQFRRFVDEWLGDTQNLSDAPSVLMHPSYHRILAMGPHVLPYIFDDISDGDGAHWLPALEAITLGQVDAVLPEHADDAILMCEDWLGWWRGNEQPT